ncbi:hypothetical protein T459_31636 [Capsicum annuum]|uniref:Uncharacterized protein n=1 Tax=Capsicum annuum TaxID=4072 RepID=A0A2G2Y419_CAPAN|nr:hypothetical protein T459_31636 [Capsicum annuum]
MDLNLFESQLYFTTHLQGEHHVEYSLFRDIEENGHQTNKELGIKINTDVRDLGEDMNKCNLNDEKGSDLRDDRDLNDLNDKNFDIEPIKPLNDKNKKWKWRTNKRNTGVLEKEPNSRKKDQRFSPLPKVNSARPYWKSRMLHKTGRRLFCRNCELLKKMRHGNWWIYPRERNQWAANGCSPPNSNQMDP